jgi:DeoR/GlpR family transcriptional regulator of sugar metabolism
VEEGVSAFDAADAAFKRAALRCSRRVMLLATSVKLATRARYRVAPLEAIDVLVVEHDASEHFDVAEARALGVDVIVANPGV